MSNTYIIGGASPEVDAQMRADLERQANARAQAYAQRVRTLTELLLSLGEQAPGLLSDRAALEEAVSAASSAWERLVGLEGQILRERSTLALLEGQLAATPDAKRPIESMDGIRQADERRAATTKVGDASASVEALTLDARRRVRSSKGFARS